MTWKSIRLELGRTEAYPGGSVSRAFLLRLPLDESGSIEWNEVSSQPSRATIRRFWASEPDRRGRIKRNKNGWAIKEGLNEQAFMFQMPPQPLRLGSEVAVMVGDGTSLPFKVARIETG